MGYDRNDQNNQYGGNGQWDRWNSNASNSSYYNQPTHRPYGQGLSYAAMILGLLSVTLGLCGLSLPLGALGLLFSLLVYRKGQRLNSTARTGMVLSIIGLVTGVLIIVYAYFSLPAMLQDESYRTQLKMIYRMVTSDYSEEGFENYIRSMESFYHINIYDGE